MEERLQKVIASMGYCSRRKAEELILKGLVSVNNVVVTELGTKVLPSDTIIVEGKCLSKKEFVYYAINKPVGVICSSNDEHGRTNITELVPGDIRVYPVGRLDYNTSGLILLTNDGDLTNKLIHPSKKIEKVYQVRVKGIVNEYNLNRLRKGVNIGDYETKEAKVNVVSVDKIAESTLIIMTIYEGKYHQVRRMFDAINHEVKKLKRIKFANISVDGLAVGEYRKLKPYEIKVLKEQVK